MGPYHAIMVHFPVALWTVASGIVVFRSLSDGAAARSFDRVLVPLLVLGLLTGVIAYALGWLVWPVHALQATPLGRNHILGATWSLASSVAVLFLRVRCGEQVWAHRAQRFIMLGLGAGSGGVLALTGTLGGHLHGAPAKLSDLLEFVGLHVYDTFYVPKWTLLCATVAVVAMPLVAIVATRARVRSREMAQ
jgi:hypothetical protein